MCVCVCVLGGGAPCRLVPVRKGKPAPGAVQHCIKSLCVCVCVCVYLFVSVYLPICLSVRLFTRNLSSSCGVTAKSIARNKKDISQLLK